MTVTEVARDLRRALGNCVNADKNVSLAQGIHFAAAQNDCSDEEVISFWLSIFFAAPDRTPFGLPRRFFCGFALNSICSDPSSAMAALTYAN
jgi:hypothetical protein